MIDHIRLASVWVSDQEAALDFYTNTLGMECRFDGPMGEGGRWIEVAPKGAQTAFTLVMPGPDQDSRPGGFSGVVLSTRDIGKTFTDLAARGVRFIEEPERQPWGKLQAIFQDPDGNMFVLVED